MRQLRRDWRNPTVPHRVAIRHALWRWRHLVGYIILTIGIVFAIASEREHAQDQRRDLANNTKTVLIAGCDRNNALRRTLQELVLQGVPQTRKLVREGTLTPEQGDRNIKQSREAAAKLTPIDCDEVYTELDGALH